MTNLIFMIMMEWPQHVRIEYIERDKKQSIKKKQTTLKENKTFIFYDVMKLQVAVIGNELWWLIIYGCQDNENWFSQ